MYFRIKKEYYLSYYNMNITVTIDHTNFRYLFIGNSGIGITYWDQNSVLHLSLDLSDYLKLMGKFASESKLEKGTLDFTNELLAASSILKKDINWKFSFTLDSCGNKIKELTKSINPIFETLTDSEMNKFNFKRLIKRDKNLLAKKTNDSEKVIKALRLLNISDEENVFMSTNSSLFTVPLNYFNIFENCPENKSEYLPFIESLIKKGMHVEFDYIGSYLNNCYEAYYLARLFIENDTPVVENETPVENNEIIIAENETPIVENNDTIVENKNEMNDFIEKIKNLLNRGIN